MDKNNLLALVATNIPDNTEQEITPALDREVREEVISASANLDETTLQAFTGPITFDSPTVFNGPIQVNGDVTGLNEGNILDIIDESKFPNQDANAIYIESGFRYNIRSPIVHSKYFVCQGGEIVSAVTDIPFLTYTGTGAMFRGNLSRITISSCVVSCPNAYVLEIIGDGTRNVAYRANLTNFIALDCLGVADAKNGGSLVLTLASFFGTFSTPPVRYDGVDAEICAIEKVFIVGTGANVPAIDFSTSVLNAIELNNVSAFGDPTGSLINGLPNSGNVAVGGTISVSNCDGISYTTPLSGGIDEMDVRSSFSTNSQNIRNSRSAGDMYLDGGSEVITVLASNTFYEIGTPSAPGVSWLSDIEDRFELNSAGYLTYIGERVDDFNINAVATVEKVGGGSDKIEGRIAINWTPGDNGLAKTAASTQNTNPTSIPIIGLVRLNPGDNVRPIFATDGSSDMSVLLTSLDIS